MQTSTEDKKEVQEEKRGQTLYTFNQLREALAQIIKEETNTTCSSLVVTRIIAKMDTMGFYIGRYE